MVMPEVKEHLRADMSDRNSGDAGVVRCLRACGAEREFRVGRSTSRNPTGVRWVSQWTIDSKPVSLCPKVA